MSAVAAGVMLFQVTRSPRAPARRPPASPPRRGEPGNSGSGGITCLIAVRTIGPAPCDTPERWMLAAIARAAIMLDGADCWAARRQELASAFGARFDMIAVAKAATVPFRIPAIGAIPLSLPRGGLMRRLCAGRCRLATRRRERSPSLRGSRCSSPSPRNSPGCAPAELRVGTRPARLLMCRGHRHFAFDPAELGRVQMSLVAQTEGARYLGSPVMPGSVNRSRLIQGARRSASCRARTQLTSPM